MSSQTSQRWRCSILIAALSIAAPAFAQQDSDVETVVVTGSLLRRLDLETASPVTVITNRDIENSGLTTTGDVVRALTADNSGTIPASTCGCFTEGASGVSLRGLTVNSTLVLINSRRTTNYPKGDDGERTFVDLNTIPLDVVDHIEVLKDGASSLYGADAIAGVVNIILKDHFEGASGEAEVGTSQHGGGDMFRFTGTIGYGDLDTDHVNGFLNFEDERDSAIHVGQRSFPFNTNDLSAIGGFDFNSVSSIYGSVAPTHLMDPTDPTSGGPAEGPQQILAPGGCGKLGKQTTDANGNTYCEQNLAPYGGDQDKEGRYGVYGRISMQLDGAEAFVDGSYFENENWETGPPSSISSTLTSNIALPAYLLNGNRNPNDPFDAHCAATGIEGVTPCQDALIHYLFGDINFHGGFRNHVTRGSAGVKGTWNSWNFDVGLVAAHAWLDARGYGYINVDSLKQEVLDGSYNFLDPSRNSPATRAALAPTIVKTSTADLDTVDVRATRDIFQLPGGTAQLGAGIEARHEVMDDPDISNIISRELNHLFTFIVGNHNVYSAFGELALPVLKTVELDVSGRFDRYSDAGNAFNPKLGARWTAIPELMLRGTYSTGFRAPSFSENATAGTGEFDTENPQTNFADWSALHHNDAYTLAYPLELVTVSNSAIKPETSTNYTLGTVLLPFADRSVSATIDFYRIEKRQAIAPSDPSAAIAAAFNGTAIPPGYAVTYDAPDPEFPEAPPRPATVKAPYINAASVLTDGLDVAINVAFDVAPDINWTSHLQYTRIFTFDFTPTAGGPTQHWLGLQSPYILSSGAGTPSDRMSWANTFNWHDLSVTGTLYYVSGLKEATVDFTGDYGCDLYLPTEKFCHMGTFWDFDLTAHYHLTESIDILGSVRNLLDVKPPLDVIDYAGINYNPTYAQPGIVGRFFTLGVTAKIDRL